MAPRRQDLSRARAIFHFFYDCRVIWALVSNIPEVVILHNRASAHVTARGRQVVLDRIRISILEAAGGDSAEVSASGKEGNGLALSLAVPPRIPDLFEIGAV